MAVGDQQLGIGELGGDGAVSFGIVDAPGPVHRAVVVGDDGPGLGAGEALEMTPGVAGVQREDRGEVVASGDGEVEAVLFRARLGALVRADEAGAVGGDANSAEQAAAGAPRAVGRVVLLCQRPERRLAIRGEDSLELPLLERLGGMFVGVAAVRRLRQVELDDVEG